MPNDTPKSQSGCTPSADGTQACARIYGQTWGTVYDTINYTTTGALGDWFDSPVGLDADGVDNEMSFSHLDRDIVFDPQGEQLHVDGDKALIYAQLSQILNPPDVTFAAAGRKGCVANARLARPERDNQPKTPPGTVAQAKIAGTPGAGQVVFDFPVKLGKQPADGSPDAGKDVFNGGLRVDITKLNAAGISDGNAVTTLEVQCKGCDDHPGIDPDADGFITVAEDYNQSPVYAQAGLTAAVNRPLAVNRRGEKVQWRALLEGAPSLLDAGARTDVEFSQGPATAAGDTSGAAAPRERAYDVANADLDRYVPGTAGDFTKLDPARIASGRLGGVRPRLRHRAVRGHLHGLDPVLQPARRRLPAAGLGGRDGVPGHRRLLESFKLQRAVFGGTRSVPLRIAYRLKRRARVTVQVRRGGKVVRSFKARTTRAGRTVRLRYPARSARRGDHRVRITVVRGGRRTVATLTSRRL